MSKEFDLSLFPARLRYFRGRNGFKQENMADLLQCSRPTYTCYETGRTFPAMDTLYRITKILGISLYDLFREGETSTGAPEEGLRSLSEEERLLVARYRACYLEDRGRIQALAHACCETETKRFSPVK